jgi:acyl-CoA reductase-like NAD-dependent aldehyde dehydrogenase
MSTTSRSPVDEYVRGQDFKLLIGGRLVDGSAGATIATVDPSTGEQIAAVPRGEAADVAAAVDAARAAAREWWELGLVGRGEVFARFGAALAEHRTRLAMLDAIDGGMPFAAMEVDLAISLANIRDWPPLVRFHGGRTIPASPGNLHYTSFRPYGVVGRIVPFNHPAMFAITRVLPALIAGNTVVLKPAEQTPLSALALGEIVREVFPPGVFNIVSGGVEAGETLVAHPDVKRVAFTGSVATGIAIQRGAAADAVKHVSLELGGKNPMIIFPDADLEAAVEGAVMGMNFGVCSGQSCGSNSRVFVHSDVYEDFLDRVGERLEAISVGPAYGEGTEMGPVVSEAHHRRVLGYMESGSEQGARLIAGGGPPVPGVAPEGGFYLRPTLFGDVTAEMKIAREEIFGPVIAAASWSDYDEVIRRANEVDLGLTASVWTNDLEIAHKTAEALESGYVWINDHGPHYWGTPFGGFKNSGIGREECIEEYESYLELKAVHTVMRGGAAARLGALRGSRA